VGEDAHEAGRKGIKRAKRWLYASMRVTNVWANTDGPGQKAKLVYRWPHGGTFSFDMGGLMRADEFENQIFSAEVKMYKADHGQLAKYRTFLAHCYVALGSNRLMCDHLMWITWAPFGSSMWQEIRTPDFVRAAVLEERQRIFGTADLAQATAEIDEDRVKAVSERIWIIILSRKQEKLIPLNDWVAVVEAHLARGGKK